MASEANGFLWFLWVLACVIAFGVGGGASAALSPFREPILTGYLALSVSLVLAGGLQWLVLRHRIHEAGWWPLAGFTAVAVMGLVVFGVGTLNPDAGWVLGVVVGWITLGVLQSQLLRHEVSGSGWWIVAVVLGLILAGPGVGFASWATGIPVDTAVGGVVRWLAFGSAYGVATATALVWLLREAR